MPSFRAWGLAAAAALGAGSGVAVAEPPPTTVFAKLFGPSKPKAGPTARTNNAPPRSTAPATLPPDVIATSLRAEQEAWERRMSVCLKLREAAIQANDEALLKQVDDLERQATALYTARTKVLGLPKSAPAEMDTDVRQAARKLTTPAAGELDPAVRTAEARTPKDVIREVRP
ncbi:MAG: hypothetical protein U0791_05820 [Gemmataceae bacterium]